jgi:hypothetical protein
MMLFFDTRSAVPESSTPRTQAATGEAIAATSDAPGASESPAPNIRRRCSLADGKTPASVASKSAVFTPDSEAETDQLTKALLRSTETTVSFPAAIIAASYRTRAVRLVTSIIAAVLAVFGQLSAIGYPPVLQLLASNAVLTLSAAWMLTQRKSRYQLIKFQIRLRSGGMMDKVMDFAGGLLGKSVTTVCQALLALAWAAYVDSGCYLTIVVALYLFMRGEADRPVATVPVAPEDHSEPMVS